MDLTVRPGPGVPRGLIVPSAELVESFSRSSGPGGQGVNTTDSRVQLSLDVATSTAFTEAQRQRLLANLDGRLDGTVLTVVVSTERHQRRNRTLARERMADLIRTALAPPPPKRRATKPTNGSVMRRLEAKKLRSRTKELRRAPD